MTLWKNPGDDGYVAVFIYKESRAAPPVINVYGPYPSTDRARKVVNKTRQDFIAQSKPGNLITRIRPLITTSMLPEANKTPPQQ